MQEGSLLGGLVGHHSLSFSRVVATGHSAIVRLVSGGPNLLLHDKQGKQ